MIGFNIGFNNFVKGEVSEGLPVNTVAPVISGGNESGDVLTTTNGTWTGDDITFSYQWQRDNIDIAGATSSTYTLVDDDRATDVRCVVTATNDVGSRNATSNAISVIFPAPVNSVAPVVSGNADILETLTTTNGTWTGDDITFSYQWQRDNIDIAGATSSTYDTVLDDNNTDVRCVVTATNPGGTASQASNALSIESTAPVNTVAPALSGTFEVGEIVSTNDGTWTSDGGTITYAYQWQRNTVNISGATSSAYTLVGDDDGTDIRCVVTATNLVGSTSANSNTENVGGFVPTDIANCALWLDASDTSTITESSGSVSQWDDKSGNNHHVTQSTGANQPTTGTRTINSLNTLDFGSGNFLERNDALGFTGNPAITAFVVAELDGDVDTVDSFVFLGDDSTSPGGKVIQFTSGSQGYSFRYNNGRHVFGASDTNQNILVYTVGASETYGDSTFFKNGGTAEAQTSVANPTNTSSLEDDRTQIGSGLGVSGEQNNTIDGKLAEVIIYDSKLSTADLNTIGNYLADKWGITWTDIT